MMTLQRTTTPRLMFFLAGALFIASCRPAPRVSSAKPETITLTVKRYGMVTGLKRDSIAAYKKLHANAWPGVLRKIKECHIRNYSIYLQKINDQYYLFSYFEYDGRDFDKDMAKMAADPTTRRWWQHTDPMQQPLPSAAAKHQIWTNMEEVFHQH